MAQFICTFKGHVAKTNMQNIMLEVMLLVYLFNNFFKNNKLYFKAIHIVKIL